MHIDEPGGHLEQAIRHWSGLNNGDRGACFPGPPSWKRPSDGFMDDGLAPAFLGFVPAAQVKRVEDAFPWDGLVHQQRVHQESL